MRLEILNNYGMLKISFFSLNLFLYIKTLMAKIQPKMEWCTRNAFSLDATENIGRCVLHSANLKCSQSANVSKN